MLAGQARLLGSQCFSTRLHLAPLFCLRQKAHDWIFCTLQPNVGMCLHWRAHNDLLDQSSTQSGCFNG